MSLAESVASTSVPQSASKAADRLAPVRAWLWTAAGLILLMVVVGGATRLTESGLSITEWKPISGVIPPLTHAQWVAEFDRYKHIPQYSELFPTMDLAQFKFIFFWEWSHRLLGRIIGLVFALPLAFFWWRGLLRGRLGWKLLGVLALGGLQGAVGWWMVKSGLSHRIEVAPERLATHLLLASVTFISIIAIAVGLKPARAEAAPARLRVAGVALLVLVLFQIGLGALVAGSRAGLIYNTWPLMDGRFIPPAAALGQMHPLWLNVLENVTTVQFDHRMIAYTVLAFALWHAWSASRLAAGTGVARRARALAGLVAGQAVIGITTLLLVVPLWAGLLHQAFAMVVLAMTVVHARLNFGRAVA